MTNLGELSLNLTIPTCLWAIVLLAYGLKKGSRDFILSGRRAVNSIFLLVTLASIALIYGFVTRDFSIKYIAEHSSRDLPMFYTISAFWAGQEGSILFWLWLLTLFGLILVLKSRKEILPFAKRGKGGLTNYVLLTVVISELLFAIVTVLLSNPFTKLPRTPPDGAGLNALLQNPGMVIHPPTLFIGYAGFTVPFAYMVGALLSGRSGNLWLIQSRPWTIASWIFLTIGIAFGGLWAYEELGWGGYWAWDPIENASLMPWFVGTAFLHAVIIQERRKMLKFWNIALITLTFELCVFGTFLTRSGILTSVHAFAGSRLSYIFLIFIALSSLAVLGLSLWRIKDLKTTNRFDGLLSRESSFLLNTLILLGLAFVTFWGTMYPLISEAFTGKKISVGAPFFNLVSRPLGLALLILTGICPLIAWRRATLKNFRKNFLPPLVSAFIGSMIFYFIYKHIGIYSVVCIFASIFVLVTILMEFYRGAMARAKRTETDVFSAFFGLIWRNKRRYGGYIVHIGIVMVFIGIMGSAGFKTKVEKKLAKGASFQIGRYNVTYEKRFSGQKRNAHLEGIELVVTNSGTKVTTLTPAMAIYPQEHQQPTSESAKYSTLREDLYAALGGFAEDENALVTFYINPLLKWIWIGCWVILAGAIIAILEKRSPVKL